MHTGIGTATCTLCGATEETVLPRDYTNHTDSDYPTTHNHCHDCGIGSYLTNPDGDSVNHNFGGWDNKDTWFDLGVIEGDFAVTLEFHMQGCNLTTGFVDDKGNPRDPGPGDFCWQTVLPVLYDEGYNAASHKVAAVFRMDWWGWVDGGDAFATNQNKGTCPAGFDWGINREAFSDMDVKLTVTKSGANMTLDWVWNCCATEGYYVGKSYEYHQGCTLTNSSKVGVALSAEWTILNVTRAELSRA